MLYHLFYWLAEGKPYAYHSPLFRATMAILLGFLIVWALGPRVIRTLMRLKIGDRPEFDHEALNRLTQIKKNTPTMGGVLIVAAILGCVLLLADLTNFYVRMGLVCLLWLAVLGGIDDWLKLTATRRAGTRDGLRLWEKMVFQIALGALLAMFILRTGKAISEQDRFLDPSIPYSSYYNVLSVPFYKHGIVLGAPAFALIAVVVIAGTSNAVNLTDGLDGLASGCVVLTAFAFMILAYVVGSAELAERLLFFPIRGAGELAVLCGAVVGACLGFLWYNAYPAQVFMGDTGALPLGGLMGYVAIVTRLELMLFIVGGIFVVEAVSVLIQIFYYKSTGGRRFFRCAPLHHHFHLGGWTETQVVTRFWLLAALFAAFALATMKLR
ncbi:MAG: phospho-N-acetylmuramoyl-pentapeptide-transferase [Planctomycetes bacterium]|nr:phospho-N-acetylmuramoyl-pentapeptide-transferase [Planctomycetota bacterium]